MHGEDDGEMTLLCRLAVPPRDDMREEQQITERKEARYFGRLQIRGYNKHEDVLFSFSVVMFFYWFYVIITV